jgi:hypothetical protein
MYCVVYDLPMGRKDLAESIPGTRVKFCHQFP